MFSSRRIPLYPRPVGTRRLKTTVVVGGVTVLSEDIVVVDIYGIVVVPEAVALDALADAEAEKDTETALRTAIEGGMSASDAYDEYGTF